MQHKSSADGRLAHQSGDTRPHACNDGWVSLTVITVLRQGDEVEEVAMYLCRLCAGERS
jgi:hypothetical protein